MLLLLIALVSAGESGYLSDTNTWTTLTTSSGESAWIRGGGTIDSDDGLVITSAVPAGGTSELICIHLEDYVIPDGEFVSGFSHRVNWWGDAPGITVKTYGMFTLNASAIGVVGSKIPNEIANPELTSPTDFSDFPTNGARNEMYGEASFEQIDFSILLVCADVKNDSPSPVNVNLDVFYYQVYTTFCSVPLCALCPGDTSCERCMSGNILDTSGACASSCPAFQYGVVDVNVSCRVCADVPGRIPSSAGVCGTSCPPDEHGVVDVDAVCQSCSAAGRILTTANVCVPSCPPGEYGVPGSDVQCTACSATDCLTCPEDVCTSCGPNILNLAGDACIPSCPVGENPNSGSTQCECISIYILSVERECHPECPAGQYGARPADSECARCIDPRCRTCPDNSCEVCQDGWTLSGPGGVCVADSSTSATTTAGTTTTGTTGSSSSASATTTTTAETSSTATTTGASTATTTAAPTGGGGSGGAGASETVENIGTTTSAPVDDEEEEGGGNGALIAVIVILVLCMVGAVLGVAGFAFKRKKDEEERKKRMQHRFDRTNEDDATINIEAEGGLSLAERVNMLIEQKNTDVIGKGASGVVYKVKDENGEWLALKQLIKPTKENKEAFHEEATLLSRFQAQRHDNVVGMKFCCMDTFCIAMAFCERGSLHSYLAKNPKLKEGNRLRLMAGVAEGLRHVHSLNVAHLDVKTKNILLNKDLVPLLSDFGVSRRVDGDMPRMAVECTAQYAPPEFLRGDVVAGEELLKVDAYCYGHLVCATWTGVEPYSGMDASAVVNLLLTEGQRPTCPGGLPQAVGDVTDRSWNKTPVTRPTMEEFVEAFEKVDMTSYDSMKSLRSGMFPSNLASSSGGTMI